MLSDEEKDDALVEALKLAIEARVRATRIDEAYGTNDIDTAVARALRELREEKKIEDAPGPQSPARPLVRLTAGRWAARLASIVGEMRAGPCGTFSPGRFQEAVSSRFERVLAGDDRFLALSDSANPLGRACDKREALARRMAAYALRFVEGSCGPDVDALAERFGEILSGKTPADEENEDEEGEGRLRQRPRREASGVASHPFAKPADDEPTRLDEAIEKARAFVFPALGAGHGLLLHWLTELRARRSRHGFLPREPSTRDSAPADIERDLAEELSALVRDCFAPAEGWETRSRSIRERALFVYRRFRALVTCPPRQSFCSTSSTQTC